jgi:predicted nucleic acid-binding protein
MKRTVFVDTSAWLAVMDSGEARHSQAVQCYTQLLSAGVILVTTGYVLAETQILVLRRVGKQAADTFLKNINHSPRIQVLYPDETIEMEAKTILGRFSDQDFSLTDALSFACMLKEGIREAFSYDQHFIAAGFELINSW